MATLGLIGARAGSRRLPGKNTADLGGKPLVAWTIERVELLQRGVLDLVILSTDADDVYEVGRKYDGIYTMSRPPELAQDDTPDRAWVADVLASRNTLSKYDTIVIMRPTSPFLTADTVQAMVERFKGSEATALITAYSVGPPVKIWRQWQDGATPVEPMSHLSANDHLLHENPTNPVSLPYLRQSGGCDVIRASNLPTSLRGDRVDLHEVSWPESCDINEAVDLEMARAWLYRDRVKEVLREV